MTMVYQVKKKEKKKREKEKRKVHIGVALGDTASRKEID